MAKFIRAISYLLLISYLVALAQSQNVDDGTLFETVITKKQLNTDSETTLEAAGERSSVADCYQACVNEASMACASFSYCTDQKKCRLSSIFLIDKVVDLNSEIIDGPLCNVYRKIAMSFFEESKEKIPQTIGDKTIQLMNSAEECAVACRNENDFPCKGFEICDSSISKTCILHRSHIAIVNGTKEITPNCKHYSLVYSSDYVNMGRTIVTDPKAKTLPGSTSLEACARACSEPKDNSFRCRSFNFNPKSQVCVLNTVALMDSGSQTDISNEFQHYAERDPNLLFPSLKELEEKPFQTSTELRINQNPYFFNEIHDFKKRRGKIVYAVGVIHETVYDLKSDQLLSFTKTHDQMQCEVQTLSTVDDLNTLTKTANLLGPVSILWLETVSPPEYLGETSVRGIKSSIFRAVYKDNEKLNITYYFNANSWTLSTLKTIPLRLTLDGSFVDKDGNSKPISFQADFNNFMFIPVAQLKTLTLTNGVGCQGYNDTDMKILPKIHHQFTFTAERYNDYDAENKVDAFVEVRKVLYDGPRKLLKMIYHDVNKNKVTEIQDFNTGMTYVFVKEACTIEPIRNSMGMKEGTMKGLPILKEPNEFFDMNGYFYYLGLDSPRGIVSDVYEKARFDVPSDQGVYKKIVTTVYIPNKHYETVSEGDVNDQVPIRILVNIYLNDASPPRTLEYNFFDFDEAEGKDFNDQTNIERCFAKSTDKKYLVITLKSSPDMTTLARNYPLFEFEALDAITAVAGVSTLRFPTMKIYFEPTEINIFTILVDRPSVLGSFSKNPVSDPSMRNEKNIVPVKKIEDCASFCVKEKFEFDCKAFSVCDLPEGKKCYLSSKNVSETTSKDPLNCQLFIRKQPFLTDSYYVDPSLMQVVQTLKDAINGTLKIKIPSTDGKKQLEFPAINIKLDISPSNKWVNDMFETAVTQRKLASNEASQNNMELLNVEVYNAEDCYQRCLREQSLICVSFSYCKVSKRCRFSSAYIDPDSNQGKKQEELDDLPETDCNVYRKKDLLNFDAFPGKTIKSTSEKPKLTAISAAECASNCQHDSEFECRGFEFCDNTKSCVLHGTHTMEPKDVTKTGDTETCTHYSKKYSVEFENVGRMILKEVQNSQLGLTLENCTKLCYESQDFNCTSINFCQDQTSVRCDMNDRVFTDDNVNFETSLTCNHFTRRGVHSTPIPDRILNKLKDGESNRVTPGGFAGTVIGLTIFGIVLGGVLFMVYSYLRSRHQNADGEPIRYSRTP